MCFRVVPTCVKESDGGVRCLSCPAGQTGRQCDRCLPGFEGEPGRPGGRHAGPVLYTPPHGSVPSKPAWAVIIRDHVISICLK